jgi:uncharacterized protein (TIGR00730 family)
MAQSPLGSVGLFCGSSTGVQRQWVEHAAAFGTILAERNVRLVYGGGGLGLMGACARAVVAGGGRVLGVIPQFLRLPEVAYEEAELVTVGSMHERKARMFAEADGFVIMPGGVGTLEEAIEILSWSRLGLHHKPVLFFNADDYWTPLFQLVEHTVREGFTPPQFTSAYGEVRHVQEILPALAKMAAASGERAPMPLTVT